MDGVCKILHFSSKLAWRLHVDDLEFPYTLNENVGLLVAAVLLVRAITRFRSSVKRKVKLVRKCAGIGQIQRSIVASSV